MHFKEYSFTQTRHQNFIFLFFLLFFPRVSNKISVRWGQQRLGSRWRLKLAPSLLKFWFKLFPFQVWYKFFFVQSLYLLHESSAYTPASTKLMFFVFVFTLAPFLWLELRTKVSRRWKPLIYRNKQIRKITWQESHGLVGNVLIALVSCKTSVRFTEVYQRE